MLTPVRTLAGAVLLAALAALSGCGSGSGGSPAPATTTTVGPTTSTSTRTPAPKPTAAVSTVKGRKHDAGTIVGVRTVGGLTVLVLNRFTVKGLSDAKLAADGAPISPHSDQRYTDQNSTKTYTVPVNPSAPIVQNSCVKSGATPTMTLTPISLQDFLDSPGRTKTVVLLSYDSSGFLTRLDTDPAC